MKKGKKKKKGGGAFKVTVKSEDPEAEKAEMQMKKKILEDKYIIQKTKTNDAVRRLEEARTRFIEIGQFKENEKEKYKSIESDFVHQSVLVDKNFKEKLEELRKQKEDRDRRKKELNDELERMKAEHEKRLEQKNAMFNDIKKQMEELSSDFLKDGKLDEEIKEIDSKTLVSLINFINQNKSNQYMSINEMMLDDEYSQELVNLIQQYFTTNKLENLEIGDQTTIIAEFLKQILTTDVELTADLKDNSIIGYKEFLESIAQKNNTDIYTLLTDEQYQEVLAVYLANLYNGDIGDTGVDYSSEYIDNFKTIVDKKVEINNIQLEEVFMNPLYLI